MHCTFCSIHMTRIKYFCMQERIDPFVLVKKTRTEMGGAEEGIEEWMGHNTFNLGQKLI
jgi:hypothetical protein